MQFTKSRFFIFIGFFRLDLFYTLFLADEALIQFGFIKFFSLNRKNRNRIDEPHLLNEFPTVSFQRPADWPLYCSKSLPSFRPIDSGTID